MADTPEFPDCNPVLFIDRKKRVWLFWITVLAERWECSQLKYRRADFTQGPGAPQWTWQGILQLKPGNRFGAMMKQRFDELRLESGMWAESKWNDPPDLQLYDRHRQDHSPQRVQPAVGHKKTRLGDTLAVYTELPIRDNGIRFLVGVSPGE